MTPAACFRTAASLRCKTHGSPVQSMAIEVLRRLSYGELRLPTSMVATVAYLVQNTFVVEFRAQKSRDELCDNDFIVNPSLSSLTGVLDRYISAVFAH